MCFKRGFLLLLFFFTVCNPAFAQLDSLQQEEAIRRFNQMSPAQKTSLLRKVDLSGVDLQKSYASKKNKAKNLKLKKGKARVTNDDKALKTQVQDKAQYSNIAKPSQSEEKPAKLPRFIQRLFKSGKDRAQYSYKHLVMKDGSFLSSKGGNIGINRGENSDEDPSFVFQEKFKKPFSSALDKKEEGVSGLSQFGYDLFSEDSNISFSITESPVGPDYLLGPGDQLTLYVWGKLEQTLGVTLDKKGRLYWPGLGHLSLLGVSLGDAPKILKKELGQKYVNFEVSVSLNQVRNIRIYVLGDVENPGAYDMSSLGNVFHALYASGGPKKIGSMRKIKVIRNHKVIKEIDLYAYLLRGDNRHDLQLRAFDTIFVPPIGALVMVEGDVIRPAIYEIKKKTSLKNILDISGGLTATSYGYRIQIKRVVQGVQKSIHDLNFSSVKEMKDKISRYTLQNGDIVSVLSIVDKTGGFVSIKGNVNREGKYGFVKGMTVSELLKKSEGVQEETFFKRADIFRFVSDQERKIVVIDLSTKQGLETKLQEWDILTVYSKYDVLGQSVVSIEGEVREQGEYKLLKDMRVADLVFLAKLKPFASKIQLEIYRREEGKDPKIIMVNLNKIIEDSNHPDNVFLRDHDHVLIRKDFEAVRKRYIRITGEVRYPGLYIARKGEHLSQVLERAGGFSDKAFLQGAVFTRESAKERETSGHEKVLEDEKKRLIYDKSHLSSLSQNIQQTNDAIMQSRTLSLKQLESTLDKGNGRIILDLTDLSKFKGSHSDVEIEDGDTLTIPETPVSVHLIGGIENPTSLLYEKNRRADYYIHRVGGYSRYAERNRVLIFKPNGMVSKNLNRLESGDTIYVPEKLRIPANWMQFVSNIADILGKVATGLAAVKILGGN